MSENHGFCIAEVLGIVSSAMSFKIEVNKDMGSSASAMEDWCCIDAGIDPNLPLPASIFVPFHRSPARWESGHFHKGSDQLSRRSRKRDGLQRVRSIEVKVPLAE